MTKQPNSVEEVVRSFEQEAIRQKQLSLWLLFCAGGIVFLAVLAVLFTGKITELDRTSPIGLTLARQAKTDAKDELDRLLDEEARLTRIKSDQPSVIVGKKRDKESVEEQTTLENKLENIENSVSEARDQFDTAKKRLNNVLNGIGARESDDPATSPNSLIASAVTRFGLLIMLLFFAQALLNLYRYSIQLSSFYWSKAMVISLSDGDSDEIVKLSKILSPQEITLGRKPKATVDDAVKIMKAVKSV